jgi:murein DD-endopeptidase MepM/ murein hydrolase activator NlpD
VTPAPTVPAAPPTIRAGRARVARAAGALVAAGLLGSALLTGCGRPSEQPGTAEPGWVAGGTTASSPEATSTAAPGRATTAPAPKPTTPIAPTTPTQTRPATGPFKYVFPVGGKPVSYHTTHSGYPATDIFADCGNPVRAVIDGTVLEVSRADSYRKSGTQGPDNGGLSVSLLGADGVRYYGSHLSSIAAGVTAGMRVRAGQQLGSVGRTGNANNVCHLHFGISPACAKTADWWIRRGVIWPYAYLDSWRTGGNRSPQANVADWKRGNGCPKAPR